MNHTSYASSRNKGFTLVEIMVVISIIGVMASIMVPNVSGLVNKAKKSAAQGTVQATYTALNAYFDANGDYPALWLHNASHVLRDYLRDYATFNRWDTFLLDPWGRWMSYHYPNCWNVVGAIFSNGPDGGNNTWDCGAWRYYGFYHDDIGVSIKKF